MSPEPTPRERAVMSAVSLRAAGVAAWFVMWADATFWADDIGNRIHPGQFTADTVGGVLVLVIALAVRWETGTWFAFILTLLPVFGAFPLRRGEGRVQPPAPVPAVRPGLDPGRR